MNPPAKRDPGSDQSVQERDERVWLKVKSEPVVRVECLSGYRLEKRPVRIVFEAQSLEIEEVEDRWYSPGATYFRMLAQGRRPLCLASR
jgi:hypothetical protein